MSPQTSNTKNLPTPFSLCVALSLLFASPSLAIDTGRSFKAGGTTDTPGVGIISEDDALANARKLVNDLNDASTGTVTSYQPGRGKEPVTCNEIMAKSLVVSNEEKAALIAEKDAVVRAAALLSEKIDGLTEKLRTAMEEIDALEQTLGDARADHDAKVLALREGAERDMHEAERTLIERKAEHEAQVKTLLKNAERDLREAEQMLVEKKEEHDAQMKTLREDAERDLREAEQLLIDTEAGYMAKMKMAEEDHEKKTKEVIDNAENHRQQAQKKVLDEIERSKLNMDALKNTTAATVARVQKEAADRLLEKDQEVAEKLHEAEQRIVRVESEAQHAIVESRENASRKIAEAEERISSVESDAESAIAESKKYADDKVQSIIAKAERERMNIMDVTSKQIEDIKVQAKKTVDRIEVDISVREEQHKKEVADIEAKHLKREEELEELMVMRVQEVHKEMERAITRANEKISLEQETSRGLVEEFQKKIDEANKAEESMHSKLESMRSTSIKLEKERSYWIDIHKSQGYCNTTLVKDDSRRFIAEVLDNAGRRLEVGHKVLAAGLRTQLELAQNTGADMMHFVKEEILPNIERIVAEACKKAALLYEAHLEEAVNDNLVQHILPIYMKHVSPVVKAIEADAALMIEILEKEVRRARSVAAELMKQYSSSVLDIMKQNEIDKMLPGWFVFLLDRSSRDGEWTVDALCKWLLILIAILFRSVMMQIIGVMFSFLWFFCPLRLVMWGRPKAVENETKEVEDEVAKEDKISAFPKKEAESHKGVQSKANSDETKLS